MKRKPTKTTKGGDTSESRRQRIRRLKRADYTPLPRPRGAKRKTKRSLRERAKKEAIRLIAKRDGITLAEARKQYKRALVEIVFAGPTRQTYRRYLEVSPGKFLELQKGKPARSEFTFGKVRDRAHIKRVHAQQRYWNTIHLLAEAWDMSVKDARKYYRKTIRDFGKKAGQEAIYIDLGVYREVNS